MRISDGSYFTRTLPARKALTGGGPDIATLGNRPQETKELAELCFGMVRLPALQNTRAHPHSVYRSAEQECLSPIGL